jgi:hypothetical protein
MTATLESNPGIFSRVLERVTFEFNAARHAQSPDQPADVIGSLHVFVELASNPRTCHDLALALDLAQADKIESKSRSKSRSRQSILLRLNSMPVG